MILLPIAVFAVVKLPALFALEAELPLCEVTRADFVREVHGEGLLVAADATSLGPPVNVRRPLKIAWLAKDGSRVASGDVVIRFDPTDFEQELREGLHEVAMTDTRITSRTVRDEGNRKNLVRDADVASLELDYAKRFPSKDETIFPRQEIIEAEIDEGLARKKKSHAQSAGESHGLLAATELDLLAIERRKSEMKVQQAQELLDALIVKAPHDGIFVIGNQWGRPFEVGQMVFRQSTVAEIPKPEILEAELYVLEADAGGLVVGLEAMITLESSPDRRVAATVTQVASLAQRRNHRVPIQYFRMVLELAQTEQEWMKPGQRLRATVAVDALEQVLTVPPQAVFDVDDSKVVYVRRGSGFEPVEVELGPASPGKLVIESGLEEGDRVALRDPTRPDVDRESGADGNGAKLG